VVPSGPAVPSSGSSGPPGGVTTTVCAAASRPSERGVHGVAQQAHRFRVLPGRHRHDEHGGGELPGQRVGHLRRVGGVEDHQPRVGPGERLGGEAGAARRGEQHPHLPGDPPLRVQRRDLPGQRPRVAQRAGPAGAGEPRPQRGIGRRDARGDAVADQPGEHRGVGRHRSRGHGRAPSASSMTWGLLANGPAPAAR
jgi:hypothetical protein